MNPPYNTSVVRRLLLAAFTDEEFTFFCYDHFREVYQKFTGGMTFTAKTQLLIEQCEIRNEFGKLLPLIKESNPAKYAEFTPLLPKIASQPPTSDLRPLSRQPFEPEMILIRAGEFLMGSDPLVDSKAQDEEQPQHLLYLPDYYLAKTPVTNTQYLAFIQSTGYQPPKYWNDGKPPNDRLNHPVVHISWYEAIAYCNWLAKITGKPYRLPSEAEWEKGARGSDGRIYPWGNEWNASRCNTRENGPGDTTSIDTYPNGASPYKLLDMAGNVWEWTGSIWGKDALKPDFKYPYRPDDGRENLEISTDETRRVVKGGSFDYNEDDARCAVRYRSRPISKGDYRGFRVAMSPF